MGKEYTVGPVSLTTSGPTETAYAVDSASWTSNAEYSDNNSGSIYAEGQAITRVSPVGNLSTRALASWFDAVGLNGQCIGSGQTVTQLNQYWRNMLNCQSGAAVHLTDYVTAGLIRLGTLSASRGEDATLSLIVDALTDGTNAPVRRDNSSVTLPTTIVSQRFTLGLVTIAGTDYDEIDSVSLDFGVQTTPKLPKAGQIWPQSLGVSVVRPVLTITGRDANAITTALMQAGAEAATHANSVVRLKKRSSPGAFVADGTSEHIEITLAGLHIPTEYLNAAANSLGTETAILAASYDGTNAPAVIDTTATYSES